MSEVFQEHITGEVVRDALQQAVAVQVMSGMRQYFFQSEKETADYDLRSYVTECTKDRCTFSCIDAMLYLTLRFPQSFHKLFLFRSEYLRGWNQHSYFIAEDHQKRWFAGSGANLGESVDLSFEYYEAGSLRSLFSTMKKEGKILVRVPKANQIVPSLKHSPSLQLPKLTISTKGEMLLIGSRMMHSGGKLTIEVREWRLNIWMVTMLRLQNLLDRIPMV